MLALGTTLTHDSGGDLRRCSPNQPQVSGGSDLHARSMDVCIVSHDGAILLPRDMKVTPDPLLQAVASSREGLGAAVACLCTW